jgi:hypothetical protein
MIDRRTRYSVERMFNRSVYCPIWPDHSRMFSVQEAENDVILKSTLTSHGRARA